MTNARLLACLAILGWSERHLAKRLNVGHGRVRRWTGGQTAVPPEVAAWLEAIAAAIEHIPPPLGLVA